MAVPVVVSNLKGERVIRLTFEVCSGSNRFRAAVLAESIERALRLVKARYPGGEARVVFPIEPEAFFVGGTVLAAEAVRPEAPEELAG
jgi:hypothetical protein